MTAGFTERPVLLATLPTARQASGPDQSSPSPPMEHLPPYFCSIANYIILERKTLLLSLILIIGVGALTVIFYIILLLLRRNSNVMYFKTSLITLKIYLKIKWYIDLKKSFMFLE